MDPLSQQILALEGQFWKTSGAKDAAIKELGLSPVRYYQLLSQLISVGGCFVRRPRPGEAPAPYSSLPMKSAAALAVDRSTSP
jgi:hypothetical protein